MRAAVLAVDGGNSKTDVALVDADGRALAHVRGPGSSPHALGVDGCAVLLDDLVGRAAARAGLEGPRGVARVASAYVAGADFPEETAAIRAALADRGWAPDLLVDNDTFALLRAGTDEPDAVAVVCGAGINCVGVAADGRQVRFPSLGRISGDWGGGFDLGEEALYWAARAEDGRSEDTVLRERITAHFGAAALGEVVEGFHFGVLDRLRLHELSPLVMAAASDGDPTAVGIVHRQADEVVAFAATALRRLDLLDRPAAVVLGGGVLTSRSPVLHEAVEEGLSRRAPLARSTLTRSAPVVGAALLGLDRLGADAGAEARLRSSLLVDPR